MPEDNTPVTRADLDALTAYLDQRFAELKAEAAATRADLQALSERHERSVTTILGGFYEHLGKHNARWTAARILATEALDGVEEARNAIAQLRARLDKVEGRTSQ